MMLASKRSAVLAIACAMLVAWMAPATAFSRLGREDGSVPDGDGVLASPLPPLQAPAGEPPATTAQDKGAATPAAGQTSQPPQPATTPPAEQVSPSAPVGGNPPAAGATAPQPPAGATPLGTEPGTAAPAASSPATDGTGGTDATGGDATDNEADGANPAAAQQAMPKEPVGPPPDVVYGDDQLPAPVRELRAKLIEAAKSGDIEKLRAFIQPGEDGTVLSFGGVEGDPIEYMKSSSGDGEGVETMAILLEVLDSGHIRNEPGTDSEIYVWPYFAGLPIDKLTKPQKVELFKLVTAGDYQEMTAFGAYNFYRVGITPDGKLQFFVAGD